MGELAGDKCIIRKRAASCILLRKRPRDSLGALHPDPIAFQIQGGQGGAERTVMQRAEEGKWPS